ncbi:MAG TPA: anthranilate synthase component I family protein [Marmoricola sp.]|nr:anthranilate synthase component I family protein [Marmoricola sp.]
MTSRRALTPDRRVAASRGFTLDGRAWSRHIAGGADSVITFDATTKRVICDGALVGDDIFEVLGEEVAEDPAATWVGYLGYACRPDLQARPALGLPDAIWLRTDGLASTRDGSAATGDGATATIDGSAEYATTFMEVQRRLRAGDSYEVNLTRRVELIGDADPDEVYANLRAINPAPYAAHLWHDGAHVLSASPESFVSISNGRIRTRPIKGTTPRGPDPQSDKANRERLANDPRYRAENLMITDLMRNDLSQVCVPGSVKVPELMQVESYAAVHQLVSTIEGDLAHGVGVTDAIRALFPAGSMTGAPKRRTMEIIDEVEDTPRGVYSGALGWISGDSCELSVIIRSLIRDPQHRWHAGTGGGITVHSDAASEWQESEWKLNRLIAALQPLP